MGGCGGATAEIGFNFTRTFGILIPLEADYPYEGKNGECRSYTSSVNCRGYTKLEVNSAAALESAIATKGSVAVVVAAAWDNYGGGIFEDGCLSWLSSCTLDHVVVVVGYTQDAWLVRSSWGSSCGEGGCIQQERQCDFCEHEPLGRRCLQAIPQAATREGGVRIALRPLVASYPECVERYRVKE